MPKTRFYIYGIDSVKVWMSISISMAECIQLVRDGQLLRNVVSDGTCISHLRKKIWPKFIQNTC